MFKAQLGAGLDVVSNDLLKKLTLNQLPSIAKGFPKTTENCISETISDYEYKDVKELRMEFEGILNIANFIGFSSLTKLQLNNNLIEKIDNLDELVNLTWLDLSHNNIDTIEGLESLTKLTDLSLQHNNFVKLEGLGTLTELEVLSLGDNSIDNLKSSLTYLRQFKKLKGLSLRENPLALKDHQRYVTATAALLPTVLYLDWKRITDVERNQGQLSFVKEIESLKHKEAANDEQTAIVREAEAQKQHYIDSSVPDMYGENWLRADPLPEFSVLLKVPGVKGLFENFVSTAGEQIEKIGKAGETFTTKKSSFDSEFIEAMDYMLDDTKIGPATEIVSNTEASLAEWAKEINQVNMPHEQISSIIITAQNSLIDIQDELMNIELHHYQTIQQVGAEYSRDLDELRQKTLEEITEYLSQVREQEEVWILETKAAMKLFFTNYVTGNAPEGFVAEPRLIQMMGDVETFLSEAVNLHDQMLLKIDGKEDTIGKLLSLAVKNTLADIKAKQYTSHRQGLQEIHGFIDRVKDDLDAMDVDEEDETEVPPTTSTVRD